MNITIAGYVGLSNAVLLAQHNKVIALVIVQDKINYCASAIQAVMMRIKTKGVEVVVYD